MDVAQALTNILDVSSLPSLLNLPGPSRLTYEYLLALVSSVTYNPPPRGPVVPKKLALLAARVAQNVWWPALSPDEVERRYMDDVDVPGDWDKVGVDPTEIEDSAILYLRRYRSAYVWSYSCGVFASHSFNRFRENTVRPVVLPASRENPVSAPSTLCSVVLAAD